MVAGFIQGNRPFVAPAFLHTPAPDIIYDHAPHLTGGHMQEVQPVLATHRRAGEHIDAQIVHQRGGLQRHHAGFPAEID